MSQIGFRARGLLVALSLISALVLAVTGAQAARPPDAEGKRLRRGILAQSAVTLVNGTGDGSARVTVDGYGEFGGATAGDLVFDPSGPAEPAGTTFFSGVWFSGPGASGPPSDPRAGRFLGEGAGNLPPVAFTASSPTRAESEWTLDGMRFQLVQELLPPGNSGSVLRQSYTVTNRTDQPVGFDLIRHVDGDLEFDGSIQDFAGVARNADFLFEFDTAENPNTPTTFLAIDTSGGANLGFRIEEYDFTGAIRTGGRAVLNNTLTRNGVNIDQNGDGITDEDFDVTLTLGRTFSLPPGQSAAFVTSTIAAQGVPSDVLQAPTNLRAAAISSSAIDLVWEDNTPGANGFFIERRTESTGFARVGSTEGNVRTFRDTGLTPNTLYTYRVQARLPNERVTSYSNEASARTRTGSNQLPRFTSPSTQNGQPLRFGLNQPVRFVVRAIQDGGEPVQLTAEGLPDGATLTPDLPQSGNPVASTFFWRPRASDAGIYELVFQAANESGGRALLTVRLLVGRTGVCIDGSIGRPAAMRFSGAVGWPARGGSRLVHDLRIHCKHPNKKLVSTSITHLTMSGRTARIEGYAKVNGRGRHPFRIVAQDGGRGRDAILECAVDGQSWPAGRLTTGAVELHMPY